jgi:chromosomal replication initiator protein
MNQKSQAWGRVESTLLVQFGENAYNGWLKFLRFDSENGGRLLLSVPSRFLRDWITTRYGAKLLSLLKKEDSSLHSFEIIVKAEEAQGSLPEEPIFTEDTKDFKAVSEIKTGEGKTFLQEDYTAGLDPRFTFENFVVGKPNELAYAAAQRVADADSVYFNPLFLYGGVGLGKTHLMHAIAWHIHHNHPSRKVIYMSAEQFMYQFVRALRHKDIMSFREQFRSVDILMIDDVQFISGKDSTQEEFFHTFNALVDKKRQIVISADKSPSDLEGIQERMRSRLGWGLVADIHPTTYELRLGILQAKIETMPFKVPSEVLEFLAHKITSNIRELEGALNRIVAHATLVGRKITLESTQLVLQDLLRANEKYVTIEDIQKHVAEHYNVRVSDMHSNKRLRVVARPRQVAMYLCKKLTPKSLPEIGRKFGGRDHTTVMHAVRKIDELKEQDPSFRDDVEMLEYVLRK